MALVQLADAIVPDVFTNYMMVDTMEKAAVFASGIVVMTADLAVTGTPTTFASSMSFGTGGCCARRAPPVPAPVPTGR